MKCYVRVVYTYGKGSGDVTAFEGIMTRGEAIDLLKDEYSFTDDDLSYVEAGKSNIAVSDRDGGDWDDPTGVVAEFSTLEEELARRKKYVTDFEKMMEDAK